MNCTIFTMAATMIVNLKAVFTNSKCVLAYVVAVSSLDRIIKL
jgi:hypothetical protein